MMTLFSLLDYPPCNTPETVFPKPKDPNVFADAVFTLHKSEND